MSPQATKEKILKATIDAIEKNGLQNITTRVIAQEAGVNNAALHYYFGTKEHLLDAALAATIEHWMSDTQEILATAMPVRDRLRAILDYLIDGVLGFPNLIRAHIQGPLMEGAAGSPFVHMLSTWLDQAAAGLASGGTPGQRKKVRIAMQMAVSSVLIAGLMPESTDFATGINLCDETFRAEYVAHLIDSVLSVANNP